MRQKKKSDSIAAKSIEDFYSKNQFTTFFSLPPPLFIEEEKK